MSASRPAKRRRVGDGGEPCRTAADATRGTMPDAHPKKRTKKERAQAEHAQRPDTDVVRQAVLAQYYGQIRTLREHVLAELPEESIIRRKKISLVGFGPSAPERPHTEDELAVGRLLDTTLVAVRHVLGEDDAKPEPDLRWEQWVGFSQKGDESNVTLPDGMKGSVFSQSEIIDFVIWLLFSREKAGKWPKHLICDGFRRHTGSRMPQGLTPAAALIPGLFSVYPNHCVQQLKESPWPQLLNLLGMAGERIMIDLLIDCSIFGAVEAGIGNLHQLSGIPISDLEQLASSVDKPKPSPTNVGGNVTELRPSDITFVRSRMLYAKAALNSRGLVHFGLRHIHVLNRFPRKVPSKIKEVVQPRGGQEPSVNRDDESCIHIMMYMFPRQFGLHNVFTSVVDRQQTAQKFQDYTLREEEIAKKFPKTATEGQPTKHVPKRLRGNLKLLVQRLQVLHQRCSYVEMLQHYCPIVPQAIQESKTEPTSDKSLTLSTKPCSQSAARSQKNPHPSTQPVPVMKTDSIIELATPIANISAFCQGVLSKLIPNEFWGSDSTQDRNKACFLKHVDKFIHLRRFESMCLHELMQGMKIREIEWLAPPGLGTNKCSQSDVRKRTEIFYEFLYYVFDSLLIPLIRSNFYVTESSLHRYGLFFFRHDVWRYVAEPAMTSLKTKMFEEVPLNDALHILSSRSLGFAQVRLLPKLSTMRPIMNLRRRALNRGNRKILGPSINNILTPVSAMLKLEKSSNPDRLGAAMFSIGDVYQRIKDFKGRLGNGEQQLYFAKVDVKAAYDTIPQDAIIELIKDIPEQSLYKLLKHVELQPAESTNGTKTTSKVTKRWHSVAKAANDMAAFGEILEETIAVKKKDTLFVGSVARKWYEKRELVALAATHIEQNIVRIGKKYYRQKTGIPQGSVLSSYLCNYFYADLEKKHLEFLQTDDCLLLRLIDDFLLITTNKKKAGRFMETMHNGFPEYGVTVSLGKSLVNFHQTIDGVGVPMSEDGRGFPYCGLLINCTTLDVSKQRDKTKDPIFNSLTVEFSRVPGETFKRKVLNAFKIQSHLMFFDTSHNSYQSVLGNAYTAFVEAATKMWAYARCLTNEKRPSSRLLKDTIKSLADVSYILLTSKWRKKRHPGYTCTVRKPQLSWLAMVACRQVLKRKQTDYVEIISWLEQELEQLSSQKGLDLRALERAAKSS